MYFGDPYGISNPAPMPAWTDSANPFSWILNNPIFQYRYKKFPPKKGFLVIHGFLFALLMVISVWIVFMKNRDYWENELYGRADEYFIETLVQKILFTIALVTAALAAFNSLFSILTGSIIRMRREISSGKISHLFTSPLTDSSIYFGNSYPILCRNIAMNTGTISFVATLILSSIFIPNGEFFTGWYWSNEGAHNIQFILKFFAIASEFFLLLMILNLAGTAASINYDTFASFVITLGYMLIVCVFIGLIDAMAIDIFNLEYTPFPYNLIYLPIDFINIGLLALFAWLTGRFGVMIIARKRRPGFYEPEFASASGLTS